MSQQGLHKIDLLATWFFFQWGSHYYRFMESTLEKNQVNAIKTEVSRLKKTRIAVTISFNASIRFSVTFIWKRRLPHWIWLVLLNQLETLRSKKSNFRFFAISIDLPRCSNPKINVIMFFHASRCQWAVSLWSVFGLGSHRLCSWNRNCVCSKHHKCLKYRIKWGWKLVFRKMCWLECSYRIVRN